MKKIWTILLAIFGFGGDAFADCYSEAEHLVGNQYETEIEYCVESDLQRLKTIKKFYSSVSAERKVSMAQEAGLIMTRLGPYEDDQIVLASGICRVCVDEEKTK